MLLPIDLSVVQEAQLSVHDGVASPKHALLDSNPDSWLVKEEKSRLQFEDRRLLLLKEAAWRCYR